MAFCIYFLKVFCGNVRSIEIALRVVLKRDRYTISSWKSLLITCQIQLRGDKTDEIPAIFGNYFANLGKLTLSAF